MAKIKYRYNKTTCSYEPIVVSTKQVFLNLSGFLFLSLLISFGLIYLYTANFASFKETKLIKENAKLTSRYELLNKKLLSTEEIVNELQYKDDNIYRTILDIEPIPPTVRQAGTGGHDKFKDLEELQIPNSGMILSSYQKLDKLKKQLYIQTKSYDEIEDVLYKKKVMWASRPAIHPLNYKDLIRTGSGFRMRNHPILGIYKMHYGIDLTADRGKPVYATGDGVVIRKDRSSSYGNVIYIDHGFGYETRYAHLSMFNIEEGQKVKRGDLIGFVGNTGRSTAPHLHYEVLFNGKFIDPVPFLNKNLSNNEFEKII
ncbi:MAG: M23 family metallopeptidase, partial [Cyclobacteriaceae bacterium]|nr:M23 family metallopeptidase [Cyclobacteriaceae bacterium]